MQLTHSSYDVNTNVHNTLLPGIRNIITHVNTGSGLEAKETDIYCPKYEKYGRSGRKFQVHTNIKYEICGNKKTNFN
jgi:hypothetical protein